MIRSSSSWEIYGLHCRHPTPKYRGRPLRRALATLPSVDGEWHQMRPDGYTPALLSDSSMEGSAGTHLSWAWPWPDSPSFWKVPLALASQPCGHPGFCLFPSPALVLPPVLGALEILPVNEQINPVSLKPAPRPLLAAEAADAEMRTG